MSDKSKKKRWQSIKEDWYSHLKINLRTLDWIIGIGIVLVIVVILIILEAAGIFYLFGK